MSLSLLSGCDNKVAHSSDNKSANRETRLREELGTFVSRPDAEGWDQLGLAATEAAGSDRTGFVLAIMRYHEARLHRDLPNSMSLVGITPEQATANHMKEVAAELACLRLKASEPEAWGLLRALILQRFDEHLRYSACEIACRTVPEAYSQLLSEFSVVPGDNLDLVQVMSQVFARWKTLETLPNKEDHGKLSARQPIGLSRLAHAFEPGCGFDESLSAEPNKSLQGVRCSEFDGSSRVLDSGVSLSWSQGEMLLCALQYHSASTSIALQRDADAWGVADCPGVVMIHDRYASNEDRLVLLDLSRSPPREKEIGHDDWASYIHSHFSVTAIHGDRIEVKEIQYAGDLPTRVRGVEVSLSNLSVSNVGPWQEDVKD